MKKIFFWALGIILLLGVIGKTTSSSTAVQGIQTTVTPTIQATATPTATSTPVPTVTNTPTPTPTPKPIYIAPTATPTPVATTSQSSGLSNDNYYTNSDGNQVHSPAYSNSIPAGATAICGDGTYSFSQHRNGTCSHHGGVAQWL